MSSRRMFKDIPIIGGSNHGGCSWLASLCLLLLLVAISSASLLMNTQVSAHSLDDTGATEGITLRPGKRAIPHSEYQLRDTIRELNDGLRQLKRDFTEYITSIYLKMKSNPDIGVEVGKIGDRAASIGQTLLGEQFADIVIKQHLIKRRLLAGLKVGFAKFLTIETLKRLVERYQSFSWLKQAQQVDLRPEFKNATEEQFKLLYTLIGLRANQRAADDVVTLTADNMQRILVVTEWFLMDRNGGLDDHERNVLADSASKILKFYQQVILSEQRQTGQAFKGAFENSRELADHIGGNDKFIKFIDRLIDDEALDIDLNQEATALELPPTINEQMMENVREVWIPSAVLENVFQDRSILVRHKTSLRQVLQTDPDREELDLADWSANAASFLAKTYSLS